MRKLRFFVISAAFAVFNLFFASAYAAGNITMLDPVKGDVCLWSTDAGYNYIENTYENEEHSAGITGRTISYTGTSAVSSGTLKYKTPYINSNGIWTNMSSRSYWKNNYIWEFDFKLTTLPAAGWSGAFSIWIGDNWYNTIRFTAKDENAYYLRWDDGKSDLAISAASLTTTGTDKYDLIKDETYHLKIEVDLVKTGNMYVTFTNPNLLTDGVPYTKTSVSPVPMTVYSEPDAFTNASVFTDIQLKFNSAVTAVLSEESFYVDRFRSVPPTVEFTDDTKTQLTASAAAVNTTPAAFWTRPPALVCAVYDGDGRLIKIGLNNTFVSSGIQSLEKYEYSLTLKNMDQLSGTDSTVKVFLWNSTGGMSAVFESITVKLADIPVRSDEEEAAPEVLQVTSDGSITANDGSEVVLKGVNFGGWLIQETWMCPVLALNGDVTVKNGAENAWANLDTLDGLESKLGKDAAAELVKAYQDNYITEWDFANVKNLGFNCIRIPFWYRNFMSDEDGTYITENDDDNPGFLKLDWACDMADKYGLYLIFDMHGCPGGQSGDHSTGKAGRNYLYKQTKYQDIMEDLWVRIAERYKGRTCVAAYDIMNEPLNNADADHNVASEYIANPWSDTTLRVGVYDRMIKAIRAVDPDHIITLEAIWRMDRLPNPASYGWKNMMYQLHSYDADDTTAASLVNSLVTARENYGVAAYMGEFNPAVYNKNVVSQMNDNQISYTVWNYKTAMINSDSLWGLYHRSYSNTDMINACGLSIASKVASSWSKSWFTLINLSDSEIKKFYQGWWTEEYLSTQSFTLNETLKNCLQ